MSHGVVGSHANGRGNGQGDGQGCFPQPWEALPGKVAVAGLQDTCMDYDLAT